MSDNTIQQIQLLTGGFGLIIIFFGILWWVLCVVLFFKVWSMTNDVMEMKETLKEWFDLEHPVIESKEGVPKDSNQTDEPTS
jgi:hypothetical protein